MRAINHAVTGAIIGVSITSPIVAVAVAVLSHFILDSIPHYDDVKLQQKTVFNAVLLADAFLCFLLVLMIFAVRPEAWVVPSIAAFAATSPDFMWMKSWLDGVDTKKNLSNWLMRFHSKIQWSQTPRGLFVEIMWFIAAISILLNVL